MDNFDIQEVLNSFRIIADTREHNTPKASERYKSFGVPVLRATMKYGDYCADIVLPGGRHLHDLSVAIAPRCYIERKMSLDELAGCFTRERARFQREFERAREDGAKGYLLVEGASWEGIINHRYRSRFSPKSFMSSLTAWSVRYDLTPVFCRQETSGMMIKEILYRDIKERLQRGDYG